jgi:CBS domain-containing protein
VEINDQFFSLPDLEAAIDRHPLIVSPEINLQTAISLMSYVQGSSCSLIDENSTWMYEPYQKRFSCALVMENSKLLGILTERDIVKLTAAQIDFESVTVDAVMTKPLVTLNENNFQDVFAALFLFRRYQIRHLPLLDENDSLIGVISPATIRHAMRPANLLKLRRVRDVMSKTIVHAGLETTVLDLARIMSEQKVSCVIIIEIDKAEKMAIPVGIVTERDIMQFQSLQLKLDRLTAAEVMSSPLLLLSPDDSLLTANQIMQTKRIRRLVVSWNWGRNLGIVTQTSLLRIFDPMEMYGAIEALQNTVKQLELEKARLLSMVTKNKLF